jgi:hypothetical protein
MRNGIDATQRRVFSEREGEDEMYFHYCAFRTFAFAE